MVSEATKIIKNPICAVLSTEIIAQCTDLFLHPTKERIVINIVLLYIRWVKFTQKTVNSKYSELNNYFKFF